MLVKILRDFHHSRDGVEIIHAKAGSEDDVAGHLVPGLEAAGLVRTMAATVKPSPPVLGPSEPTSHELRQMLRAKPPKGRR